MKETELKKFSQLILVIADLFDKELNTSTIKTYFEQLKEFEYSHIEHAFMQRYKFFPKPFDIAETIRGPETEVKDNALIQATLAVNAIEEYGRNETVQFNDPITNAVIQQCFNGWIEFCSVLQKDVKWLKRDFIQAYMAYKLANLESYKPLIGWFEMENNNLGYKHKQNIKLIGLDKERKQISE